MILPTPTNTGNVEVFWLMTRLLPNWCAYVWNSICACLSIPLSFTPVIMWLYLSSLTMYFKPTVTYFNRIKSKYYISLDSSGNFLPLQIYLLGFLALNFSTPNFWNTKNWCLPDRPHSSHSMISFSWKAFLKVGLEEIHLLFTDSIKYLVHPHQKDSSG